jgi:hypothetical protein
LNISLLRVAVPAFTALGVLLWVLLQYAPDPTFNYHGSNSFWGPLLLNLVLGGASRLLLLGAGPLAVYLLLVEQRSGGLNAKVVVVAAVALLACTFVLARPLCASLLPGASPPTHVAVAVSLTAVTFALLVPGVAARLCCAAVASIAAGAIVWSVTGVERDPQALERAVSANSVVGARVLLAAGHNPNAPVPVLVSARGLPMVQLLLDNGADPNGRVSGRPATPLSEACKEPDVAAVVALLDAGARVDDVLALKNAADWLYGDHIRVLLAHGADASAPDLLRSLVAAAPYDAALLKLETAVLAHAMTPERAEERDDALGHAIWKNNVDAVTLLLPTVADRCSGKSGSALDIARRLNPALVPMVTASCDKDTP